MVVINLLKGRAGMLSWKARNSALAVVVGVFAVLAACSSGEGDVNLTSKTWSLVEYGEPGATSSAVGDATIRFDDATTTAVGSTSCNSFSGGYAIDGDSMSFGPIAATERACIDPPGVMEQEADFLRILTAVTRFEATGSELRLESPDGILVFRG